MDFKGWSDAVLDDRLVKDDVEALALMFSPECSFSCFPTAVDEESPEAPKSRPVAGVFGVLAEDPKDANAPDPKPKAEDAPDVGEATLVVFKGEMALKGFDLPCEELSPPNRFAEEYVRGESDLVLSLVLLFALGVDKESLVELSGLKSVEQTICG